MYCPKCRSEYVDGVTECADCQVPLVTFLPPEPEPTYQEMVTVLTTTDSSELLVAKSMLEGAGITFFAQGEGLVDLFGKIGFNPAIGAVEVKVRPEDVELAREVLETKGEPLAEDSDPELPADDGDDRR